jgi:hypothetical protein
MAAKPGMDMAVTERKGGEIGTYFHHCKGVKAWWNDGVDSGVSFREKVQYPIDIGSVADMAEFEFQIEIFFYAFNLQREGGTIGKMIDDGTDPG